MGLARSLTVSALAAAAAGCVSGSIDAGQPVDYALLCASPSAAPFETPPPAREAIVRGAFVPSSAMPGAVRTGYLPVAPNPRAPIVAAGAARTIYLNRDGADLKAGYDDAAHNTSSVLASTGAQSATIPPAKFTDEQWLQYVSCVRDEFARFNVQIVADRPGGTGYMMEMVGGSPSDLGLGGGVGGIAPIDPNGCSVIEGAVAFVFPEALGNDVKITCEAGAQEIAHAFSLDHELLASDPMTYLPYDGHKTFQDQDADCGESAPRQCICMRPQQNSVKILTEKAGLFQDPNGPSVSITAPDDGAMLPAGPLSITVHATHPTAVARVTLHYHDALSWIVADCAGGALACARSGDDYTFTVKNARGLATFFAEAADAAGDSNLSHTRTVSLGPVDNPGTGAITLEVALDLATFPTDRQAKVNATITTTADTILSATVLWTDQRGVSSVNPMCPGGGVGGWTRAEQVAASPGERSFVVQATDSAGNRATSPRYTMITD